MPTSKKPAQKKSSVGGGSYKTAQRFNLKKALPIVAVMMVVGGIMVFRSFASSTYGTSVTQWYRSCGYSNPPTSGASWQGWVDKIKANPANQSSVYAQFKAAAESAGKKCPVTDPAPAPAPATTGGSTGSATTTSANPLKDAQAWTALGAAHVANAKKENETTYKISLKNPVTKTDLSTIAQKEGYVRSTRSQMYSGKTIAQGLYNQAISKAATKAQGPAILVEIKKIQGHIDALSGYIANISADYKRAEATYETNLTFFSKLADSKREEENCFTRRLVMTQQGCQSWVWYYTPKEFCRDGFYPVRGTMAREVLIDSRVVNWQGNAPAITCNKNPIGTTPKWDVTKVDTSRICAAPSKPTIHNQRMETIFKNDPPSGYVCFNQYY